MRGGQEAEFLLTEIPAYKGSVWQTYPTAGSISCNLPIESGTQPPHFKECAKHPVIKEAGLFSITPISVHILLLGAKGAGGGEGAWYPVQGYPYY